MEERVKKILDLLDEKYGIIKCYLNYENTVQLLVATILSARCTDDMVNKVTESLFKKYKTAEDFANADINVFEQEIRSTGFYKNKAKNIIQCCKKLVYEYEGKVPSDIESLTSLDGVGRKTANVIRGNIYGIESIVVDTHVKRISKQLGLTESDDPVKIEYDLMNVLPKDHWIRINTQLIAHGRKICKAPNPKCEDCFLKQYCKTYEKNMKN